MGLALPRALLVASLVSATGSLWAGASCGSPEPDARDASGDDGRSDAAAPDAFERCSRLARDGAGQVGDGGMGPCLVALTVTVMDAAGNAVSTLTPSFAPDIHDYYVRCPDPEANTVTVSMTAAAGAESMLLQPRPSPRRATQARTVSVAANGAIVAAATSGAGTTEYWVRCLPPDFPPLGWAPHPEVGAPPPGYYAVGAWFPTVTGAGYGMLLDRNGVPVWYVRPPTHYGAADVDSVILHPPAMTYFSYAGAPTGAFQVFQVHPYRTYEIAPTVPMDVPTLHELQVTANGHYLALANPVISGVDLTGLTIDVMNVPTPLGKNENIEDCLVVEFDLTGNILWTWSASDHFHPAKVGTHASVAFDGKKADAGLLVDIYHCNSIDIDPTSPDLDRPNLLISARDADSVFYVERASGRVAWKLGGAPDSKDGAVYLKPPSPFYQQHDARLLSGWRSTACAASGDISLFDDESPIPGANARALVFHVSVGGSEAGAGDASCVPLAEGGAGEAGDGGSTEGGPPAETGTASLVWQYEGPAQSTLGGSFRVLPDGSRVIGWGATNALPLVFTEVDVDKHDLLDFSLPPNGTSYRAIKLPLDRFDLQDLRRAAGRPGF